MYMYIRADLALHASCYDTIITPNCTVTTACRISVSYRRTRTDLIILLHFQSNDRSFGTFLAQNQFLDNLKVS